MQASDSPIGQSAPIVTLDDESANFAETSQAGSSYLESKLLGQLHAEMLAYVEPIQTSLRRRLEYVGTGRGSGGNAPSMTVEKQGHLGLRAREAELPAVTSQPAGAVPLDEVS
jgi:hypothetical protein